MEDIKKNNETMNQEEKQNENAKNPDEKQAKEPGKIGAFFKKHSGKIKQFFSKHKGKIRTGLAIAGGVAVGVAADKFGLHLGKKKDDQSGGDAAE